MKRRFLVKLRGGEPFVVFALYSEVDTHGFLKLWDIEGKEKDERPYLTYAAHSNDWQYCRFIGWQNG